MTTGRNTPPGMPSPIAVPWPGDLERVEIPPDAQNQVGAMQAATLESALETSACLWEAVLTLRDHPATDPDAIALALAIRETCDAIGTADLRLTVVGWTGAVEAAWSAVADSYDRCFDWDFVPGWIIDHIDWSDPAHPSIRPDPLPPDLDPPANARRIAKLPPDLRSPAEEGN